MKSRVPSPLAVGALMLGLAGCGLNGAASLPEAPSASGSAPTVGAGLPAGTWRLVALREAGQAEVAIARPDLFTADFGADGRVHLRADCNRCTGAYTSGAGSLTVGPMACTRAYCAATAPLDDTFTKLASEAKAWNLSGRGLELSSEAGTLRLQQ